MRNKKYIEIGVLSLFLFFILSATANAQTTVVSVSPATQNVPKGGAFTVDITINPGVSIAGAQFDLSFNYSLVSVINITEGNLLKQGGANTYFSPGTIDNTAGTITGVAGAITTPGQMVSSSGVFARIQMTAKSVDGTSSLDLSNVIVGDINGNPVSIMVNDGTVTVGLTSTLQVSISESPDPVSSGGTSQVTVHVTSGGSPVQGASVSVSATCGSLTPTSGSTDSNGDFKPTYNAPTITSTTTCTISATASKTGYTSGSGSDTITFITNGGGTVVRIDPMTQVVNLGQTFTVNISVDPTVPIAGAQFDLSFNPSLATVNSVTEGNLLKQGGANTYFSPGTIDNTAGTITGVAGAITTPGQMVSSSGVFARIQMTAKSLNGTSALDLSNVIVGDINGTPVIITVNDGSVTVGVARYFDTGIGTYPSIAGTHNGTLTLLQNITVSKLYTYTCPGTGGHTEYVKIWNSTGWNVAATWNGYKGDWHNITFNNSFTLYANKTYNYTIKTGSYPQIIHASSHNATGGVITCTEFVDVNDKRYERGIPAIRLE